MADHNYLALYGLKYNPFMPAIPAEDLWSPPGSSGFFFRAETLVLDGGFALIDGPVGIGKSKFLQLLHNRLTQVQDVVVGVMERPQSSLNDFYRELGELFGVDLTPANRYGGFKALRARWHAHIKASLMRPVLLIDEAQEAPCACLNELRLLGSVHFDSECILTTIICGDQRLQERLRRPALMPLESRIRARITLQPLERSALHTFLDHLLEHAGAPALMTDGLRSAIVEHCAGNPRILTTLGFDLLSAAAQRELAVLDEALFFDLFTSAAPKAGRNRGGRR